MTKRESEIYYLIKADPYISQNEIAEKMQIARSSVAVHISNLMKKGYIRGKGYIVENKQSVTVIGGANVDIEGIGKNRLVKKDSNPGEITMSLGGVGRNIAENLSKLGISTRLITAYSNDFYGEKIKENADKRGIDISDSLCLRDERTSTYMYILDEEGDMMMAISDMNIIFNINEGFLRTKLERIDCVDYTVIDTNLSQSSLEYLANHLSDTRLVLDPVSSAKAVRAKNILSKLYAIKPNRLEVETLLDKKLNTKEDIIEAGQCFLDLGIEKVLISLGADGVYYVDRQESFFAETFRQAPINATGSGDAMVAGFVYGLFQNLPSKETVEFALGAAAVAGQSQETIASDFCREIILDSIQKNKVLKMAE